MEALVDCPAQEHLDSLDHNNQQTLALVLQSYAPGKVWMLWSGRLIIN